MQEALFYKALDKLKIQCLLCPHECIINEGNRGYCKTRLNVSGKLYSTNYGKLTALHLDPIEKKPLYQYCPGKMIFSIGSFGCNFKCSFCQNYHISHEWEKERSNMTNAMPNDIVSEALKNQNSIGIAYTYNEPVVWFEFMYDVAVAAKSKGLNNVVVSNGYINEAPLDILLNVVDAFNIDLKFFDETVHKKQTGGDLKFVKNSLKAIKAKNKHLEITNLIIPGLNDDKDTFELMVKWIKEYLGYELPLHINRYFPRYKMDYNMTPKSKLYEFVDIAKSMLNNVYCGNI